MNDGVFMYSPTNKYKKGKLSLLYQVLPFSYIFEKAGGAFQRNQVDLLQIDRDININDNLHDKQVLYCL